MHGFILKQYNLMAVIYTAASVHLLAIDILYPSEHWKANETQQNNKLAGMKNRISKTSNDS